MTVKRDVWKARCEWIISLYDDDPERAHVEEDRMLYEFVAYVVGFGNEVTREAGHELLKLKRTERTKWYA